MKTVPRPALSMVQALTILTALQMFSDGDVVPQATATSEPYGISRSVVEGAILAGNTFNTPPPSGRDLDIHPVPALSQVTPTSAPDSSALALNGANNGGVSNGGAEADPAVNEIAGADDLPLVPERTPCNAGLGETRYEKLPDVRLAPNSYDSDVIRKNAMPSAVLALCEDRCLKDRTATQQLTRRCGSIDFVPGRRFSSYSDSVEYTETKCFLSQPQEDRTSDSRTQFERANNYAHLREVCFSASTGSQESPLRRDCPDRLYVMERTLAKRFLPKNIIEVRAPTMEACQSACLLQQQEDPFNATSICRSGTWERGRGRCFLSSYTRRTHPAEFVDDPDMDYFENTCLSAERRCPKNQLFFLKESNAEMGGPFDLVTFANLTLQQCQQMCIESKLIFCRSLEYDQRSRLCVLSDEDSISRRDVIRASTSSDNVYYELTCVDGDTVKGNYQLEPDAPITSLNTEPLNARAFRDVRTAFQLYRNRHLELRAGFRNNRRERTLLSLAECLDECLEERTFACRSVMYSQRYQTCRLSEYDQYNGELIYDGDFDYFENLMGAGSTDTQTRDGQDMAGSGFSDDRNFIGGANSFRGGDSNRNRDRDRFGSTDDRFAGSSSATSSKTDFRGSRPSVLDERPGLFRPISTEFNDQGTFGFPRNGAPVHQTGSIGSFSSAATGRPLSDTFRSGSDTDRFSASSTRNRFDTRNDRFGSDTRNPSSSFGSGRFSSTATGPASDLFGSGGFGSGGGGAFGAAGGVGAGAGGAAQSTSSLGTMSGEGSDRAQGFPGGLHSSPSVNFAPWGSTTRGFSSEVFRNELPPPVSVNSAGNVFGGSSFSSGFASSKCYDTNNFEMRERGLRMRHPFIKRYASVGSREDCSRECLNERQFFCKSYNYRSFSPENCELSDQDFSTLDVHNPDHAERNSLFQHYTRNTQIQNCLEVAQSCNEDGSMEFTLRTDEPFRGRIYAYGYYDRCFYVGRGSSVSVLQLSAPRGFPDCGTLRFGDTMTNIVVVQFSENVQTMMDKRYNLTCTTIGPSDSVVTSGYIGAGYGTAVAGATSSAGAPTPIEYLELENRLDQRVALRVLYDGRPTTTIAVGDPLTFRLEPQAGYNLVSDIFATNVVAKDPYSGRAVQLIDSRGCPVDNYIFPALGRARSGDGLETRFSAFKIPESNFLVFEANVRPCKTTCTPAFCRDTHGRGEVESFGRRRRRGLEERLEPVNETSYINMTEEQMQELEKEKMEGEEGPVEHVHGIYEVYLSRDEIPVAAESRYLDEVCLTTSAYQGLLVSTVVSSLLLLVVLLGTWFMYRRFTRGGVAAKNARADSGNPNQPLHLSHPHQEQPPMVPFPGARPRTVPQPARYFPSPKPEELALPDTGVEGRQPPFIDPSEPIYTDPTLFERLPDNKPSASSSRHHQA